MASPRDPDEVEQTLVPGPPPESKPKPADAGDTPAQPLPSDVTLTPAPVGDTLPPLSAAPGGPNMVRVGRGQSGKLSIPIRVGPPSAPLVPSSTDETLASGAPVAPASPSAGADPSGTFVAGSGVSSFESGGTPTEPLLASAETLPPSFPPAPAPGGPRRFAGPSVPVRPVAPCPSEETVALPSLETPAPVLDQSATFASGAQAARGKQSDFDATQVPHPASGTHIDIDIDPAATLPAPGGTVASDSAHSGGMSDDLTHDTAPITHAHAVTHRAPNETGTMVGRFALRGLHASGGLGEVFTARDTELNREVAVKRIKARYADDPGSRRRFLTEAELTARLDHPGVVPVFGLVNDARGRPVYAMRFIRGETLKDEIDRYHGNQKAEAKEQKTEELDRPEAKSADAGAPAAPAAGEKEVPRTVAFRKLLSRFVYVCQAIAYAHQKGIIHRDIKPANVMVGGFGEVLVVDWGLAKSLTDGPDFDRIMQAQAESGFRHDPEATDLPSHMTTAGTAVGTPSYMPPEQAAGELDKVGPRADVYSLGATLFAILTGRAPFVGKGPNETLELVRRGAFDPPTAVTPDCPKPLAAVCLKAMALHQEDRYATAQALAADVERWLSDEPVTAYRDPPLARLARWARRHPSRVAVCVSLLIAGVLAAGGIAWAVYLGEQKALEEQRRTEKARQETADALAALGVEQRETAKQRDEVKAQKEQVEKERDRVTAARNLARERYKKAVETYNTLIRNLDAKLADRENMQAVRERLLLDATDGLKKLVETKAEGDIGADSTLVAAHRQMGAVYQLLGKWDQAKAQFAEAVRLAEAVKKGAAETDGRAPEARAAELREADRDLARTLVAQAGALAVGDAKGAQKAIDEAVRLLEMIPGGDKDPEIQKELADAKARRGEVRLERGKTGPAVDDCRAALAIRKALFENPPSDPALTAEQKEVRARDLERSLADSYDALAGLQIRVGKTDDAIGTAKEALRVRKSVHKQFSTNPDVRRELAAAHTRLAEVLFDRALMSDAETQYRAAVDVLEKLVAPGADPENAGAKADLAALYGRLGQVQLRTGDLMVAVGNTEKGRAACEKLLALDLKSAKARRDLAQARERHGDALLALARARAARGGGTDVAKDGLSEYREGLSLLQKLKADGVTSAATELEIASGFERVGDAKLALKDADGALKEFQESEALRRTAVTDDSESASAKRDLAVVLYKQAEATSATGKPAKANKLSSEATKMLVNLTRGNAASGRATRDLAVAYGKWGQVLAGDGRPFGALLVWQNSLHRFQDLAKRDAGNKQAQEEEAEAWERLAGFYSSLGNSDRALAAARNALKLWDEVWADPAERTKTGRQRLALARIRVGDLYTEGRQFREAGQAYTNALKEVEELKSDPLLGPVVDLANDKLLFLAAVRAGLSNPRTLKDDKQYAPVRLAALRTVALINVRAGYAADAANVAAELATSAESADDLFAVARTYAGCAGITDNGTEAARNFYAKKAVEALLVALKKGFRNADALTAPEWDAVRARAPKEFAAAQEQLTKLRGTE